MSTPSDRPGRRGKAAGDQSKTRSKKPYKSPRLVTYGNLSKLALAKGGLTQDGPGAPNSKG